MVTRQSPVWHPPKWRGRGHWRGSITPTPLRFAPDDRDRNAWPSPPFMLQVDPCARHLAAAGLAAKLSRQLADLSEAGCARGIASRKQSAGRGNDDCAAIRVSAEHHESVHRQRADLICAALGFCSEAVSLGPATRGLDSISARLTRPRRVCGRYQDHCAVSSTTSCSIRARCTACRRLPTLSLPKRLPRCHLTVAGPTSSARAISLFE
jgi:hypothetical protein